MLDADENNMSAWMSCHVRLPLRQESRFDVQGTTSKGSERYTSSKLSVTTHDRMMNQSHTTVDWCNQITITNTNEATRMWNRKCCTRHPSATSTSNTKRRPVSAK